MYLSYYVIEYKDINIVSIKNNTIKSTIPNLQFIIRSRSLCHRSILM